MFQIYFLFRLACTSSALASALSCTCSYLCVRVQQLALRAQDTARSAETGDAQPKVFGIVIFGMSGARGRRRRLVRDSASCSRASRACVGARARA